MPVPPFRSWSIRWRLTAWYALSILLILTITGTIAYYTFRQNYVKETDRSLTVKGMEVIYSAAGQELLFRGGKFLQPPLSADALISKIQAQFNADSYNPVGDPIYMRLFKIAPTSLALISHNVKMHDLIQRTLSSNLYLQPNETVVGSFVGRNEYDELRVVNIRIPREPFVLQLATPWQHYEDILGSMVFIIAEIIAFGFSLSALGGWILVGRTLRPITEIVTEASKMSGDQLEPSFVAARTNTDDEIGHLVSALNAMMSRVHQSIITQRQFTADASHDLKTPLAILRGEMELALTRDRSSDEYRRVLVSGLEETDRLIRIVSDLRELAKSEFENGLALHRDTVNLTDLVRSVVNGRIRQAGSMNVHLCAILPKETISIVADASSIGRAIGNLIDNAMTYNVEGGSVEVSLKNSELYALVVVRDTGFGISQADCEHIFDRFYRGDKSRASNKLNGFSNTGLGLAIVKSVIAAHNGTVSVVSEVNTGSTFTVTLPLAITNADRKQLAGRC